MRIAIQGERGSNSHMAALDMVPDAEIVPCAVSAEVFEAVLGERVDAAVLPIENSLHGSVAEHYDLLFDHTLRIDAESQMRIRHNLIAMPGVRLEDVTKVISHPVALSQCRKYLRSMEGVSVMPFYDTAGSVKHVMAEGLRDTAGVAPELAAKEYGGTVLVAGIEDHEENFTRFHLLRRVSDARRDSGTSTSDPNKMSVAFVVEHRPGTLVRALQGLSTAGVDLTKIESRPVPGTPWEYVFYVDFRFAGEDAAAKALAALRGESRLVKELGRYVAA
ncbi:MAG: prephenate dehydratase domain-containing protein [Bryocella sp.]